MTENTVKPKSVSFETELDTREIVSFPAGFLAGASDLGKFSSKYRYGTSEWPNTRSEVNRDIREIADQLTTMSLTTREKVNLRTSSRQDMAGMLDSVSSGAKSVGETIHKMVDALEQISNRRERPAFRGLFATVLGKVASAAGYDLVEKPAGKASQIGAKPIPGARQLRT